MVVLLVVGGGSGDEFDVCGEWGAFGFTSLVTVPVMTLMRVMTLVMTLHLCNAF